MDKEMSGDPAEIKQCLKIMMSGMDFDGFFLV
jgi:hypothetical protein